MGPFEGIHEPAIDDVWRAIVLHGQNVQSYKFALAKSLLEIAPAEGELIRLDDLSVVYARHLTEHLKGADKQGTSKTSKFLDTCRRFNAGTAGEDELISATVRNGFVNVIDAFHVVERQEVSRFFVDERKQNKGIRITNNFSKLSEKEQFTGLAAETEARWRLVETAWELNISRALVSVDHDKVDGLFYTFDKYKRRRDVTSSRDALNGYQKDQCFYCYDDIYLNKASDRFPEVDHFFPHVLKQHGFGLVIDGAWNLVLACQDCNRGPGGKFASVPSQKLLGRLWKRNEYLIGSNHPLKETLLRQTGNSEGERKGFFRDFYNRSWAILIHQWEPSPRGNPRF